MADNGLVHIASITGTSDPVFDNVFTTDYDFYLVRIFAYGGGASGINLEFRASGVTETSANYTRLYTIADGSSLTYSVLNSQVRISSVGYQSSEPTFTEIHIGNPAASRITTGVGITQWNTNANHRYVETFFNYRATTVFDGVTFTTGGSDLTGTTTIWGYRK